MPIIQAPPTVVFVSTAPKQSDVYTQIKAAVTSDECDRVLAPIVVGAQVYDLANTARIWSHDSRRQEADPWSRMFTGPSHRNVVGLAVGMAVLDWIKLRLTAHSKTLRCAALGNQLITNLNGIGVSNR